MATRGGDRPAQAGRGPGARGERDAAARACFFFSYRGPITTLNPSRNVTIPEPSWWYNCNIIYKMLEVLEAAKLMLMG